MTPELRAKRIKTAENSFAEMNFPYPVKDYNGWEWDGSDRMDRTVFLERKASQASQISQFTVVFAAGTDKILQEYTNIGGELYFKEDRVPFKSFI